MAEYVFDLSCPTTQGPSLNGSKVGIAATSTSILFQMVTVVVSASRPFRDETLFSSIADRLLQGYGTTHPLSYLTVNLNFCLLSRS